MHTFTTGSHKDGNINDSLRSRSEGCGGRRTRAWKEGAGTGTEKERGVGQRRSGEWDREGAGSGTENERARFL